MNRQPGQNRGRPRLYTPAEAKRRHYDQRRAAEARDRANPKLCSLLACTETRVPGRFLCFGHAKRQTLYGSPVAGPLKPRDLHRSVRRVLAALPKIDKAHPGLLTLAEREIDRIIIRPGQQPLPLKANKRDLAYHVAHALHRLQHPHVTGTMKADARRRLPLSAHEALVGMLAGWLCVLIPGSTPGSTAKYDTEEAIAYLVARSVLAQRRRPTGERLSGIAVGEIGRQLVAAFGKLVLLVQRQVQLALVSSNKRAITLAKKAILQPPPTKPEPKRLTFAFPSEEE